MLVSPTIVVPGITAAYLDDRYPLPPETIWTVLRKEYERAALHPDNLRYEASEPALVRSGQLFEIAYRELIEELRHNLRDAEDEPVPVFPFSYDWRQPIEIAAASLSQFIDEVIDRTKLLRHYDKADYGKSPKVNLIGHSMGGLVILAYLLDAGKKNKVDKIVTLATPFRGSFESVVKVTTGTADLGTSAPSSREREAARVTPSLYYLLPDIQGATSSTGGAPRDLFDPKNWQTSILETIAEYIRLRGLDPAKSEKNRLAQARELFERFLASAKALRGRQNSFKLSDAGFNEDRWLCVVGVDTDTRIRLEIGGTAQSPEFKFRSADRKNNWRSTDPALQRETGDGTVPYDGAIPSFLPAKRIVCISPDDYGYWELGDKATTTFGGFHGILPNMNMLHRLIVRYFKNAHDSHKNTWGRIPVGVAENQWQPPLAGGLEPERNGRADGS